MRFFFRIALWIPLRENIVSSHIVYIFKTAGDSFWSNFETLIKVSTETFSHRSALNLKHLCIRKSRLLVTTLYLQISYHDLKLKLIPLKGIPLGIPFNNKVGQLHSILMVENLLMSSTPESIFRKRHVISVKMSSTDPVYQRISS